MNYTQIPQFKYKFKRMIGILIFYSHISEGRNYASSFLGTMHSYASSMGFQEQVVNINWVCFDGELHYNCFHYSTIITFI